MVDQDCVDQSLSRYQLQSELHIVGSENRAATRIESIGFWRSIRPPLIESGSGSEATFHHRFCPARSFRDACWNGRNTEKTVQLRPGAVLLFTRIDPWCLFTMFVQTQRPRPVPTSFLVLKNGSKSFERTDGGMPCPESAMVM